MPQVAVYNVEDLPQQVPLLCAAADAATTLGQPLIPLPLPQPPGSQQDVLAALAAARQLAQQQHATAQPTRLLEVALVPAAAGGAQLEAIGALRAAAPTMYIICWCV
jgi:hypothetical protein